MVSWIVASHPGVTCFSLDSNHVMFHLSVDWESPTLPLTTHSIVHSTGYPGGVSGGGGGGSAFLFHPFFVLFLFFVFTPFTLML